MNGIPYADPTALQDLVRMSEELGLYDGEFASNEGNDMSKTVWHSGPPPSIGWWPANRDGRTGEYRWWNGEYWSYDVSRWSSSEAAACHASCRTFRQEEIKWTERPASWPARSRT